MPTPVIVAMKHHLDREAMLGGYEAEEAEADTISAVYGSAARLISADVDEVALTENATVAWTDGIRNPPIDACLLACLS